MCSRGAFYGQVSSPLVLSPSGDIVQLLPVPPPPPVGSGEQGLGPGKELGGTLSSRGQESRHLEQRQPQCCPQAVSWGRDPENRGP